MYLNKLRTPSSKLRVVANMTHSGRGPNTTTILLAFEEEVCIVRKLSYSKNLLRLNSS